MRASARFGGTACGSLLRNGLWIRVWGTVRDRSGSGGPDRVEERSRLNGTGRHSFVVVVLGFEAGTAARQGEIERGGESEGYRAERVDRGGDPGRQRLPSGLSESLLCARSSGRPGGRPPSVRNEGRRSQR